MLRSGLGQLCPRAAERDDYDHIGGGLPEGRRCEDDDQSGHRREAGRRRRARSVRRSRSSDEPLHDAEGADGGGSLVARRAHRRCHGRRCRPVHRRVRRGARQPPERQGRRPHALGGEGLPAAQGLGGGGRELRLRDSRHSAGAGHPNGERAHGGLMGRHSGPGRRLLARRRHRFGRHHSGDPRVHQPRPEDRRHSAHALQPAYLHLENHSRGRRGHGFRIGH